ncbi:beta-propeller domain-containing protein [Pseudobythopirellula maris]|uniref:beta-propeller domain-containing protein n=1 Tax=Pseudobythopirellula maris TaxID=2527991 RepID=UPI0018D286DC|nr:beta-propeller domain-containing protein [Pseudobythopirellula maris]
MLARRSHGGPKRRRGTGTLRLEQLEPRLVMDGAGFVNTDPPEDPDTIVGVAEIDAQDDHVETSRGVQELRIDPLGNDPLPAGAEGLTIKSVSGTKLGAEVTISEDGKRLIYNAAGDAGLQAGDTFYYIVQTEDGKLGKANVTLSLERTYTSGGGGGGTTRPRNSSDNYSFFEDAPEQSLHVLTNDREFSAGEIVAVTTPSNGGSVRIADDGRSLLYQPQAATTGRDLFEYTVRNAEGEEATIGVSVNVSKPYYLNYHYDNARFDFGTGPHTLDPLANDSVRGPVAQTPRIVSFSAPDYAGQVTLSEDGQRFLFEPAEGFLGSFSVSYSVRYGPDDHQTVEGSFSVAVERRFLAVENYFSVDPGATGPATLDVLTNDPVYNYSGYYGYNKAHYQQQRQDVSLRIVGVAVSDAGGEITIAEGGQTLLYTPAEGFTGEETFEYTVEASNGSRETARVTVRVGETPSDPSGVDRFATEGELNQFLIDKAVARYGRHFGIQQERYAPLETYYGDGIALVSATRLFAAFDADGAALSAADDFSGTNVQVEGVDEADIVETDGRYVYTFALGKLAIVDLLDPSSPELLSMTLMEGGYDQMYLMGDRITLLRTGSTSGQAEVLVLDVGDRSAPAIAERTEIDGYIADSRAIGDKVHLVVQRDFLVPELEGDWLVEPAPSAGESNDNSDATGDDAILVDLLYDRGEPGVWRTESLEEYIDRVRDELIETALPAYRGYNAAGELVSEGLLTTPTDVHKPLAGADRLLSFVTIDAGDGDPAPPAESTTFVADRHTDVYVSAESAYVFAYDPEAGETNIYKMDFAEDGSSPLVASGVVGGSLLNQFSADEHDGRLRVATTEVRTTEITNSRGRTRTVQSQRFNNVLVLEQNGNQLETVGEITNLAPTETIKSVRFMGDRAYVVTFRVVDPLFAIDLSDPTAPTVEGALKIPGFSDYLHPVGEDYLVGIGRDADEITGRLGPAQLTLFYVGDLSDPTVVDQMTLEGAHWTNSEAWSDHHAVAYFAGAGLLTVPHTWNELAEKDMDGDGLTDWRGYEQHSAMWAFQVETDGEGGGSLGVAAEIEHEGPARRSLRIDETLVTVSGQELKTHDLDDPTQQLGEVWLGALPTADAFTVQEDSGATTLDVLANDRPGADGEAPSIVSVTQPVRGHTYRPYLIDTIRLVSNELSYQVGQQDQQPAGEVTIAEDGRSLVFTPAEDFFGTATLTYTVLDPLRGEQTATVTITVEGTPDAPDAEDDTFSVEPGAVAIVLNVLANDTDPDAGGPIRPINYLSICGTQPRTVDVLLADLYVESNTFWTFGSLTVTELGPTDNGGVVELDDMGRLHYTPVDGFEGVETFSYTVVNGSGLTDTATASVYVGVPVEPPIDTVGPMESTGEETPAAESSAENSSPVETSPAETASDDRFVFFSAAVPMSRGDGVAVTSQDETAAATVGGAELLIARQQDNAAVRRASLSRESVFERLGSERSAADDDLAGDADLGLADGWSAFGEALARR